MFRLGANLPPKSVRAVSPATTKISLGPAGISIPTTRPLPFWPALHINFLTHNFIHRRDCFCPRSGPMACAPPFKRHPPRQFRCYQCIRINVTASSRRRHQKISFTPATRLELLSSALWGWRASRNIRAHLLQSYAPQAHYRPGGNRRLQLLPVKRLDISAALSGQIQLFPPPVFSGSKFLLTDLQCLQTAPSNFSCI